MIKGWVQRDSYDEVISSGLGLVQLADLRQVVNDDAAAARPEPVEHRVFGNMDRATRRRPGWCVAISAASERIAHYETGNHENKRGWHTGSGWLQWWSEDGLGQYSDAYWPTVDPAADGAGVGLGGLPPVVPGSRRSEGSGCRRSG